MFLDVEKKPDSALAGIESGGGKITYGELCQAADEFCSYIGKRELIFCICKNSIAALTGYVGALSGGIVPLLLSEDLNHELLLSMIETYRPAYLWMPEEMKHRFDYESVFERRGYVLLKTESETVKMYSELGLLLTTSGSTGSPKLVRQSYKNISSNAAAIAEYLELTPDERPITTLPMNYTYGLSIINSHLLAGAAILFADGSYTQKSFWEFFKHENATSFGGVPYTYEILKRLRFFNMELPSLKTMTQAGGKLSPELHKEFAEYAQREGKRFVVMYGQTEATARMSYLPYEKSLEKYGSMGIAIPGGKFSLIDVNGYEIDEPEITGELVYQGDNVTLGYAVCREDLEKGDERKGILITGDMAKKDKDGYYYIVGRKKRFLKIFGNRVNLDECEIMIKKEFDGADCACTGIDDKMNIYITDADAAEKSVEFMSAKLGLHMSGFEAEYIEFIPKNNAGKTLYAKLK